MLEDGQQSLETSGKGLAQGSSDVSGGLVHECVHRFVCDWKVTEMLRGGASAEEVGDGGMSGKRILGCPAFCIFLLPDYHEMRKSQGDVFLQLWKLCFITGLQQ